MEGANNITEKEKPTPIQKQKSVLATLSKKRQKALWFFNDMRVFVAITIINGFFAQVLLGYYRPMVPSIELQFQLTGGELGLLVTAMSVGNLVVLPFMSFFGSRWHIPRVLGAMEIIKGLAIVVLILPHFLFGQNIVTIFKASVESNIEVVEAEGPIMNNFIVTTPICHPARDNDSVDLGATAVELIQESRIAFGLLILSYLMFGITIVAGNTLGMVYIDNNFNKAQLPLLFGVIGAMAPLGPFVGGLLSIVFNRIYVDLSEPNIPMDDPKWISAWWAGLLVVLAPFAMLGPLLCLFPRRMRKKGTITIKMPCLRRLIRGKNADDDEEYKEDKKKIKTKLSKDEKKLKQEKERLEALEEENEFRKRSKEVFTLRRYPIALFRLLTTPIFMLIVFNSILSDFAWSGWPTFEMKYYYQIFRVPAWKITTINNVADLLLSPLGSLCGGIIISRLRPSYATVTLLTLFSFIFYAAIGVGRMFITCGDSNYAGFDYNGPAQLMGDCNAGCECGLEAYSPVCDNGLTYFTPCHAGCELGNNTLVDGVLQPDLQTFYNCNCTETGFVVPGRCEGECDLVYLYVGLRAFSSFVWKLTRTVDILVIIRSVGFFEKAFALGLNSFLGTLLGSLPSAPVIGLIIDSACRVFQEIGGDEGSCWIYDTDQLRFRMYGYTLGIMALEIAVYLTIFYLAKKKNLQLFDEDDPITLEKRERAQKMGEIEDDNKESDESHNSNVKANSAELGDIEMTKEQNSSNHQTKL